MLKGSGVLCQDHGKVGHYRVEIRVVGIQFFLTALGVITETGQIADRFVLVILCQQLGDCGQVPVHIVLHATQLLLILKLRFVIPMLRLLLKVQPIRIGLQFRMLQHGERVVKVQAQHCDNKGAKCNHGPDDLAVGIGVQFEGEVRTEIDNQLGRNRNTGQHKPVVTTQRLNQLTAFFPQSKPADETNRQVHYHEHQPQRNSHSHSAAKRSVQRTVQYIAPKYEHTVEDAQREVEGDRQPKKLTKGDEHQDDIPISEASLPNAVGNRPSEQIIVD